MPLRQSLQKVQSRWHRHLPGLLLGIGFVLRARQYLFERLFWSDEAALALNIVGKSFADLFKTLDDSQIAPPGFLLVEKIIFLSFGPSELGLRALPFFSSILALILFYALAIRCLARTAALLALGIFAVSPSILYCTAHLKPYSADIFWSVLLFLSAQEVLRKQASAVRWALLTLSGVIAIWFSFPAVFILAGVGLAILRTQTNEKQTGRRFWTATVFLSWGVSFALYYLLFLRGKSADRITLEYWISEKDAFFPLVLNPVTSLKWLLKSFLELLSDPGGFTVLGLAALPALLGLFKLAKEKPRLLFLLTTPLFFAIAASAIRKYPFQGRMIQWTAPIVVLIVAEGVSQLKKILSPISRPLWAVFILMLFWQPAVDTAHNFRSPTILEDIGPSMHELVTHRQNGDLLYVYYGTLNNAPAFRFYFKKYGLTEKDFLIGLRSRNDWSRYIAEMDRLRGNRRVWFLFSRLTHPTGANEEKFFLCYLDSIGTRIRSFKDRGASVYLFDLSQRPNAGS